MPNAFELQQLAWQHAVMDHHGIRPEPKPIATFTGRLVLAPTNQGGKTRPTPTGEYRPVLFKRLGGEGVSCRIRYDGQLQPGSETIVTVDLLVPDVDVPASYTVWETRVVGTLYVVR